MESERSIWTDGCIEISLLLLAGRGRSEPERKDVRSASVGDVVSVGAVGIA